MSGGGLVKVHDDGAGQAEDESCEGEDDGDGGEKREGDENISLLHLQYLTKLKRYYSVQCGLCIENIKFF